jgi:hypothetical protein
MTASYKVYFSLNPCNQNILKDTVRALFLIKTHPINVKLLEYSAKIAAHLS